MSAPAPLRIDAVVDAAEHPALMAAAEQLRTCLAAAAGLAWPVTVRFLDDPAAIDAQDRPTVALLSLLPELLRDREPLAAIEARLRAQLSRVGEMDVPALLICTIFRHVPAAPAAREHDARPPLRERIRRLNLLAIVLSHDMGAGVVDVYRVFATVGARELATDSRLA